MRYGQKRTDLPNGRTRVEGKCQVTGKDYALEVPTSGLDAWLRGEHIQEAMPDVPKERREFLMSGMSPEGWDEMSLRWYADTHIPLGSADGVEVVRDRKGGIVLTIDDSLPRPAAQRLAELLAEAMNQVGFDPQDPEFDHDHPNTEDCVYSGAGIWKCGVAEQH